MNITDFTNEGAMVVNQAIHMLESMNHENNVSKGWISPNDVVDDFASARRIALMHSELSEALEAIRLGNPNSEKIPDYSALEEELADLVLRVLDMTHTHKLHLGGAIIAKLQYNSLREYKHGGKRF